MNGPAVSSLLSRTPTTPSAARPGVYWTLLASLARSSWLISGLVLLYLMILVFTQLFASTAAATAVYVTSLGLLLFVGFQLGHTTSGLWGNESRGLVPDYRRRLMRVASGAAFTLWLVIAGSHWFGHLDHSVPWIDSVWIGSYGILGWAFVVGFFGTRKLSWPAQMAKTAFSLFPVLMLASSSLREWLFTSFTTAIHGYSPIVLLSLLLGPHTWPVYFARKLPQLNHQALQFSTSAEAERRARKGTWMDGFVLQELLLGLHRKGRLRPEFLVFPASLLGYLFGPSLFVLVMGGVQGLGIVSADFQVRSWTSILPMLLVMAPISAPLSRASLGRYVLLPGAVHRKSLPAWLAQQHLIITVGGIALLLLPSLLVAVYSGVSSAALASVAAAFVLALLSATALHIFFIPSPATSLFSPAKLLTVMSMAFLVMATAGILTDGTNLFWATATVAATLAACAVLTLWGLQRWKSIDLSGR